MEEELARASALNLCREEWDYRILAAAGYLSIGQVVEAGGFGLKSAASKIGAPFRCVVSIQEVAAHHGLDIPLFPAENPKSDGVNDNQPNGHN